MELKYDTLYQLCDHYENKEEFDYYFILDPEKSVPEVKKSKIKNSATKIYGAHFWGNPNSYICASSKFEILGILNTHQDEYTFNGRKYRILYDMKGLGFLDKIKQVYFIDVQNKIKEICSEQKYTNSIPDEYKKLEMQNNELKSVLSAKTKKCQSLESELQKLHQQINYLAKSNKQFETQNNELKLKLASNSQKYEELGKNFQENKSELTQQQQNAIEFTKLKKRLESQNNDLKSQLANKIKELKDLQQELHQINEKDKLINKSKEDSALSYSLSKQKIIKILDKEDISNIERGDQIGQGKCGTVVKVYVKQERALKELDKNDSKYEDLQHLMNEYETMNMLNHPNILKVHGIFLGNETTSPSILLDYCHKNLENEINGNSLSKVQIVCIIYQIASGMRYVHLNKIIHRDLKPSDILIDDEGIVKICDFGMSRLLSGDDLATTINVGTANFISPEIMNGDDEYTEKVDVYSFGVLLYFVLSDGQMPNISSFDVCMGKKAKIPKKFTEFARKLIDSCWSFEANDRPSFKEICDQIEANNYALLNLTKDERNHILDFIREYKAMLPNCSI